MKIAFTSDTHWGHNNMVKFSNRPFSAREQTEKLIEGWNSVCDKDTVCYHLGDFALGVNPHELSKIIERLNFRKLIVIQGNHERSFCQWKKRDGSRPQFDNVIKKPPYYEVEVDTQLIILCHYPILSWRNRKYGSWMLHGHCHDNLRATQSIRDTDIELGKIVDVGVDGHDFKPWTYNELESFMSERPNTINHNELNDHHC